MSEVKAYTVAIGNIDPFMKASRDAIKYICKLKGFLGIHPCPPRGTLILFSSENAAKRARNNMNSMGIQTGNNICECFFDEKYLR